MTAGIEEVARIEPGAITVGVDASWEQTGAVEWALDEARGTGTGLHVVNVIDARYTDLPYLAAETARTHAQDLIAAVGEHLQEGGPEQPVTASVPTGKPGPALAEAARGARILVVGRRGIGSFGRLLIGSTSESAVNHADVPVVVVPQGWHPDQHRTAPVLVGVDTARPNDAALEFAFTVAAERRVPVHLVRAWDVPTAYVWDAAYVSGEVDRWRAYERKTFDELIEVWTGKYPEVEVHAELRQSHPVPALLDRAKASGARLVVVGGRRHSRFTGFVLGSVTRGVLHHADCPVAVVHDVPASRTSG